MTNQKEKHKVKKNWAGIPFIAMSLVDTTILFTINNYKCLKYMKKTIYRYQRMRSLGDYASEKKNK